MNARMASASARHLPAWARDVAVPARRCALSRATQHIILEWVKCSGSLRTSQMPLSGRRQIAQTRSAISARRRPVSGVELAAGHGVDPGGLHQIAVDVELLLAGGTVADAHRARAAIAGQRERRSVRALAAVEPVEDAQPRMRQLRGVQQPPEEGLALVRAAELHQRAQRERRVAQPAEAVVPVALPADLLGQRARGRRRDRAGWRVDQQLERQRAADDRLPPRPCVGSRSRPVAPERDRRHQARLRLAARREHERLLMGDAQDHQRRLTRRRDETAADRALAEDRIAGRPRRYGERVTSSGRHRRLTAAPDRGGAGAVLEPGLDAPAHRHAPRNALHASGELADRSQPQGRQQHRVGHPRRPGVGRERGLEHVGVGQIAASQP